MTSRTQELYGFVKGDVALVKEGLRVRVFDKNQVEWTDPSETFLTRATQAGIVYKVRAIGSSNPNVLPKTGLVDGEEFYVVFQEVNSPLVGLPGRDSAGHLVKTKFRSTSTASPVFVLNLDLYLLPFAFTTDAKSANYVERPTIRVKTEEPDCTFLITTNGLLPTIDGVGVTTITAIETFTIDRDGPVVLSIAGVDLFGNVGDVQIFYLNIEYPTAKILEPLAVGDIQKDSAFYQNIYTINNTNKYTKLTTAERDTLLAVTDSTQLAAVYYVELEPGIFHNWIFGPRYVRLGSNREGTIEVAIVISDQNYPIFTPYDGAMIVIDTKIAISTEFTDQKGASSGIVTKTYDPIAYGPVIEQVIINNGENVVADRLIRVAVLAKGTTPQMITIGQNPILFPVVQGEETIKIREELFVGTFAEIKECAVKPFSYGYGYGYGYGSYNVCDTNFCFDESTCTKMVHTAFDRVTAFEIEDKPGLQFVYVRARSYDGDGAPIVRIPVILDSILPELTVDPLFSYQIKQADNTLVFSGTKTARTAVVMNGKTIIPANDQVLWSHKVYLASGNNKFEFFSIDARQRQSPTTTVNVTYEFVFNGVLSAIVQADAEGNWSAPYMSLPTQDPAAPTQLFYVVAEVSDNAGNLVETTAAIGVVDQAFNVVVTDPVPYVPIADCEVTLAFKVENSQPLTFRGPYTVRADENGAWEIEGVILEPSIDVSGAITQQILEVSVHNQDGSEQTTQALLGVQLLESIIIDLDGTTKVYDPSYPFEQAGGIPLGPLANGTHVVKLLVQDVDKFVSSKTFSFVVDKTTPTVVIKSPVANSLVSTVSSPILEYTITSSSPIFSPHVFIDGKDYGTIGSGDPLPALIDGFHTVTVVAETIARCESDTPADGYGYGYGYGPIKPAVGKKGSATVVFEYLRPLELDLGGHKTSWLNIGNDINGARQGECILEEARLLNVPSSDADILNDWYLLSNGIRFQNQPSGQEQFTSEQLNIIATNGLDRNRVSMPKNTLVLLHFDSSYQSEPGVDNRTFTSTGQVTQDENGNYITTEDGLPLDLQVKTNALLDLNAAVNQLAVDVFVHRGDNVDRDLIKESIRRAVPARAEPIITFATVP